MRGGVPEKRPVFKADWGVVEEAAVVATKWGAGEKGSGSLTRGESRAGISVIGVLGVVETEGGGLRCRGGVVFRSCFLEGGA